ncbi:MAG TPA: serine/threonine-protein kinase, partial [Polyangiaceae bacterium]|nr:serine/threonine-protein kinase [Polyangiaceae bacterium]
MAVAALQEGEVFAGRYRIVRELASGGMGAVYEVVHAVTERRCALKVMLSHTVERETLRKRFMQESRLAAQIGSEYIVDVLDAGVDEVTKAPFLVMELLEGEDLGQRLLRLGPLTARETVTYLWNVALALDRTHQAGIVHRDLKASNLFLTRREDGSPFVKVLDFGVAKVLPLGNSGEQRTQTVGTPIYMAPEQFRADGRITPATDI